MRGLNEHQKIVWDRLSEVIEDMPDDGMNCSGEFSATLKAEQRSCRKAVRYARFKAIKALRPHPHAEEKQ